MRASASPTAAQRVPPRWMGPVGFAETNSRLMISSLRLSFVPYAAPASTIVFARAPAAAASDPALDDFAEFVQLA